MRTLYGLFPLSDQVRQGDMRSGSGYKTLDFDRVADRVYIGIGRLHMGINFYRFLYPKLKSRFLGKMRLGNDSHGQYRKLRLYRRLLLYPHFELIAYIPKPDDVFAQHKLYAVV